MRIFYEKDLDSNLFNNSAVALGSFEALHAGHIEIINNTVKCAKENNIRSIVTIFKNPILKKRSVVCETLEERINILKSMSVDNVVIFEYNKKFSEISDIDFFNNIIVKKLAAKHVFAGFNYRFGYKASGDTNKLKELCNGQNINLNIVAAVKRGPVVSSTYIYELITSGDARQLNNCLLRPYSICGKIISGRQIGREIGFPTANIELPDKKAIIADGVYFGKCSIEKYDYFCIINVGPQPTVTDDITPKIEVHILSFEGDIYGKNIKVEFLERLRDIKTFMCIDDLKAQLHSDKKLAEELSKSYI